MVRAGLGSSGGAPIWTMKPVYMPSPCTCGTAGDGPALTPSIECPRHGSRRKLRKLLGGAGDMPFVGGRRELEIDAKRKAEGGRWLPHAPYRRALEGGHDQGFRNGPGGAPIASDDAEPQVTQLAFDGPEEGDPDGLNVFGRYPKGWLEHVVRVGFMGDVTRDEILHVCSGTLAATETWTVDVRGEARPSVQADGTRLPFRDGSFKAVMIDPPYSESLARNLYGTENPRPAWLLREAARVTQACGRIGFMHVGIPFAPPRCWFVGCWPITIGVGFRVRVFTVYEKDQASLL